MKRYTTLTIALVLTAFMLLACGVDMCSAEGAREWNTEKLVMYGLSSITLLVDYKQTSDMAAWHRKYGRVRWHSTIDYERHIERNKFIGAVASQGRVNEYFFSVWVLLGGLTWWLDNNWAIGLNATVLTVQIDVIEGNVKAGWAVNF